MPPNYQRPGNWTERKPPRVPTQRSYEHPSEGWRQGFMAGQPDPDILELRRKPDVLLVSQEPEVSYVGTRPGVRLPLLPFPHRRDQCALDLRCLLAAIAELTGKRLALAVQPDPGGGWCLAVASADPVHADLHTKPNGNGQLHLVMDAEPNLDLEPYAEANADSDSYGHSDANPHGNTKPDGDSYPIAVSSTIAAD